MNKIEATEVKTLRERTGAGFMDCKKALVEAEGDTEKAVIILRQKGLAAASKRIGRKTAEGKIGSYIHAGGKIGVMVELNCETDFVAQTPEFQQLLKDLTMQVAAARPRYIRSEDIPEEVCEKEREIYRAQAREMGKPEKVWDRIVEGKLRNFYKEVCLLDQPFIREPEKRVGDLLKDMIAKLGENIVVRRFARFQMGENE